MACTSFNSLHNLNVDDCILPLIHIKIVELHYSYRYIKVTLGDNNQLSYKAICNVFFNLSKVYNV